MTTTDLSEKTVLVTGALGAIAESVIRTLHEAGAFLVLTDLKTEEQAAEVLNAWKTTTRTSYYKMDVTNKEEVSDIVNTAFEKHPNINVAIGNAGGCGLHHFARTGAEEFDRVFKLNYTGQTYFTRAVLDNWVRRNTKGHMVYTSSYVARVPHQGVPAYASAKAALETFAKCLALEYAEQNIRFNVLSPGNVAAGSSLKVFNEDEEYREMVIRVTPLKRQNSPQAIANAFLYMCSDLAEEMNGHILNIDLGVTIPKIG